MPRDSPTRRVANAASSVFGHVGLAYDKLVPVVMGDELAAFVRNLVDNSRVPTGYDSWFRRWARRTPAVDGKGGAFTRVVRLAVSQGRVLCGLGELTPTENGLSVHATYGVPYLPGSSLKGIVRAWLAETVAEGPWSPQGRAFADALGRGPGDEGREEAGLRGAVSFLDALWVPNEPDLPDSPWAAEIVTPHYMQYYAEATAPDGTESPKPSTFLAAQGGFRIVLEGPAFLVTAIAAMLEAALAARGVGAKTRAGYGQFRIDSARVTMADRQEREATDARSAAENRARAFSEANSVDRMLEAMWTHESNPTFQTNLVAWLTEADHADERLKRFPVTVESARDATAWATHTDLTKKLTRKLTGKVPEEILDAVRTAMMKPTRLAGPTFGSQHIGSADFTTPPAGGKALRAWPNSFAESICDSDVDEDTARRAIDHLRRHGGRAGHIKRITERYGINDE